MNKFSKFTHYVLTLPCLSHSLHPVTCTHFTLSLAQSPGWPHRERDHRRHMGILEVPELLRSSVMVSILHCRQTAPLMDLALQERCRQVQLPCHN